MQWKRAVFAEKMRMKTVAADASDADADATAVVRQGGRRRIRRIQCFTGSRSE